jgi:molybdopterin-guanine dinucleotide biosynthesis protein MobB
VARTCIQVVGSKKTGKTSLLEDVSRELRRRGRSVCYLKHRHENARLDADDTDTDRMMKAGARVAALVGDTSAIVFRNEQDEPPALTALRQSLPGEIVLAEGWKSLAGPKIVVAGGDLDIGKIDGVIAVVGDPPQGFGGRVIQREDVAGVCDLIERTAEAGGGDVWRTSLIIDGREIELNTFVQDIFASAVMGMSLSLRDIEGGDTLELRCARKRPAEDE